MSMQNIDHPALQTGAIVTFAAAVMQVVPAITAVLVMVYYLILLWQTETSKQVRAWLQEKFGKKPPPDPDYSGAS